MQQTALTPNNINLAAVIREAREAEGVSIRELARRANVSAGQISRIESGSIAKPSSDTLRSLARGLGRSPLPLLFIAGHLSGPNAIDELDTIRQRLQEMESSVVAADAADDWFTGDTEEDHRYAAYILFNGSRGDPFGYGFDQAALDEESLAELKELIRAWPALSPERRRLMRALVADQEILSSLERLPTAERRVRFDVQLEERDADDRD